MTDRPFVKLITLLSVVAPLAGTLCAIWLLWQQLVTWRDIAILGGMYCFTALGITIGFHRLLTHRSFAAPSAVRFIFLVLGSMAPTRMTIRIVRLRASSTPISVGCSRGRRPNQPCTAPGCSGTRWSCW